MSKTLCEESEPHSFQDFLSIDWKVLIQTLPKFSWCCFIMRFAFHHFLCSFFPLSVFSFASIDTSSRFSSSTAWKSQCSINYRTPLSYGLKLQRGSPSFVQNLGKEMSLKDRKEISVYLHPFDYPSLIRCYFNVIHLAFCNGKDVPEHASIHSRRVNFLMIAQIAAIKRARTMIPNATRATIFQPLL